MICLMALFDSELRSELFLLMELTEIKNYTHFVNLHGSSEHGKKEGTVAWPGSNEILMLIVNSSQYDRFKAAVEDYKAKRTPAPGLLVFGWPLKELF